MGDRGSEGNEDDVGVESIQRGGSRPVASQVQHAAPPQVEDRNMVAEIAPWIGGSYAWGLMTALTTKGPLASKVNPFLTIGTITAGAAVARFAGRELLDADGNDALVTASGGIRGALTGAAVGATLAAAGAPGASTLRTIGRGTVVGAGVGIGLGVIEALTDTYVL